MMISSEQIKAARAWIDYSRSALAADAGVSPATIRNLENGKISQRSAEPVRLALESKGFKFFGRNGLIRHTDENRTYEGSGSCDAFYEDLLATVKEKGGDIAAIFRTQEEVARSFGIDDCSQLKPLDQLTKLSTVKCLLSDVQYLSMSMPSVQFRATPVNTLGLLGTIAYGDKTAVVITHNMDFTFHVKKSVSFSERVWENFSMLWKVGVPLTVQPTPSKKRI